MFKCQHCEYETPWKGNLTRHMRDIHNIGVVWHQCEHCTYKTKRKYDIKRHLEYIHDIGDKQCEWCARNCNKVIEHKGGYICRKCYRKDAGHVSRKECRMSDALDEKFGTDYLLCTDSRVYGNVCQKYRPDKLYASPGLVLHIECDENQHKYNNGDYTCDEKRILDIYDEFIGNRYIVIRWNPDAYKTRSGKRLTFKQRIVELQKVMAMIANGWQAPNHIYCIFMFYDDDAIRLTKRIQHTVIHSASELKCMA